MYRIIAILLVGIQAAGVLAPLGLVSIRATVHARVRAHVLSTVPVDQRTEIQCTASRYREIVRDEGKEIEVNGVMYDVISLRSVGEHMAIACVRDDAETAISRLIMGKRKEAAQQDPRMTGLFELLLRPGATPIHHNVPCELPSTSYVHVRQHSEHMHSQYAPAVPCPPPDRSV